MRNSISNFKTSKKIVFQFITLLFCFDVFALDLSSIKRQVVYECKMSEQAGFFVNLNGELSPTVFDVDKSERWLMQLQKIENIEQLGGLPYQCSTERNKFYGSIDSAIIPNEYCLIRKYKSGSQSIEVVNHCRLGRDKTNGKLICGVGSDLFFDSDRLYGVDANSNLLSFSLGFSRSMAIDKFECKRLDR